MEHQPIDIEKWRENQGQVSVADLNAFLREIEQLRVYKEAWNDIAACGKCADRGEVVDHFNELAREHGLTEIEQ